jgi:hypothetical protein
MKRIFFLCLLAFGILLLIRGVGDADSMGSEWHRFFTAPPPDKAMWFLIGGVLCVALGAVGVFTRQRTAFPSRLTPIIKNGNPS